MKPGDPHWLSAVEAPEIISDPGGFAWDDESDLVVVGFGGAGAAAAAQANDLGLSVIAVDRFHGGGATKASGGVLYAGGGTKIQKEAGVDDDPDNMFAYLKMEVGEIIKDETLRAFCEESSESVDWLMSKGVDFRSEYWPHKTSYPGVNHFLYHPDNSLVPSYAEKARPAARGHRGYVPPEQAIKAVNLGGSIWDPLADFARAAGVKVRNQAEARQLLTDSGGRVIGVRIIQFPEGSEAAAEHKRLLDSADNMLAKWPPVLPGYKFVLRRAQKRYAAAAALEQEARVVQNIRAKKGVLLSAGGFVFNRKMVEHYAKPFLKGYPLGTTGDDGSGIRLGQTVGGAIGNMDRLSPWRFINPPLAWAQGIIVNRAGKRFTNEMHYGATLGIKMVVEEEGRAWTILNKALVRQAMEQVKGGKVLPFQRDLARLNFWIASKKASTLEALAHKVGIAPAALKETVAGYNHDIAQARPDVFGKADVDRPSLETGPYYAIDIGLGAKLNPCPTITLGGLLVDEATGQVRAEDGGLVDGLYAAGRNAVGICSWKYVSGLSIGDCVFSGRRAARSIAQNTH